MFIYRILCILFLTCINACSHATGTVVCFHGTGSAGKSSLCKELMQYLPSSVIIDEDELYCNGVLLFLKTTFSPEFCDIASAIHYENIFHAIVRNQVVFKEDVTDQERTDALVAIYSMRKQLDHLIMHDTKIRETWGSIKKSIIHEALSLLDQGYTLIVDSVGMINLEDIEKAGNTVVRILVYCPFKDIVQRILQRNTRALLNKNLLPMRYYSHLLLSFVNIYDLNENSEGAIDTITKQEVAMALDSVDIVLPAQRNISCFTRSEFNHEQLHEYRNACMKKFAQTDALYVVPKNRVDFCVRTDRDTLTDLLKYLESRLNYSTVS